MAYIIMGRDECNAEFRPRYPEFRTEEEAYRHLNEAIDSYPEARSIWVEELMDKQYFLNNSLGEWEY